MMKIKSSFQAATWTGSVELTKKRATARTMHQRGLPAVFWPNWHAANLNTKQSITNPLRSLSTPVAIRGRAAVHHSINPQHLVGLPRPPGRNDWPLDRTQLAAAPGPQRQMVGVRNIDGEVNVAPVERAAELGGGGVRDAPIRVQLGPKPLGDDRPELAVGVIVFLP